MKNFLGTIGFGLILVCAIVGIFEESAQAGVRGSRRFGVSVGFNAEPAPSDIGFNLNYNLSPFMRLVAGYGTVSQTQTTTLGGGARFFIPTWDFSPFIGISYNRLSASATSATYASVVGGIDWQTSVGLNLGGGVTQLLDSSGSVLMFGYVGWYFSSK
jgi:hypothetical protein